MEGRAGGGRRGGGGESGGGEGVGEEGEGEKDEGEDWRTAIHGEAGVRVPVTDRPLRPVSGGNATASKEMPGKLSGRIRAPNFPN